MSEFNKSCLLGILGGRRGRDHVVVGFTVQSVHITTDVVSLNLDHGEVYNIM